MFLPRAPIAGTTGGPAPSEGHWSPAAPATSAGARRRRAAGRRATRCAVLDVLLHGQEDVAARARRRAASSCIARRRPRRRGAPAARSTAPTPSCTSPRSSAIPPARATRSCPTRSTSRARRALVARRPRRRASSASCSPPPARTTAAWPIPTVPIDETGELRPVSLYAEQKVGDREGAARAASTNGLSRRPACASRPSTASAPRMRFDLTVNEFTRDLWADAHARGLRRAVLAPLRPRARRGARGGARCSAPPVEKVAGEVFNAGHSDENYRKLDLVEIITGAARPRRRGVRAPRRGPARLQGLLREDQATSSASSRCMRVPDGIDGARRRARGGALRRPVRRPLLEHRLMDDAPADPALRRPARADATSTPWRTRCARAGSRWARARRSSRRRSPSTSACKHAVALSSCTAALHLAYLAAGVGPGRRGDRPGDHVRGHRRRGPLLRRRRRCFADIVGQHDLGHRPRRRRARASPPRTKAVCAVHYGGYAADRGRRCASSATTRGLALIEDAAHSPSADAGRRRAQARHLRPRRLLQLLLQQGPLVRRGRPARHRRRRGRRAGRAACARTR